MRARPRWRLLYVLVHSTSSVVIVVRRLRLQQTEHHSRMPQEIRRTHDLYRDMIDERDTELASEMQEIRKAAIPIRLRMAFPAKVAAIVGGFIISRVGQISRSDTRVAVPVISKGFPTEVRVFVVEAKPTLSGTAVVTAAGGHIPWVRGSGPSVILIPAFQLLESYISGSPFFFGVTFPIQVAAIVNLMRVALLGWDPCLRLRIRLWLRLWLKVRLGLDGRSALAILISVVAIRPILIAVALPIDEAAVVDLCLRLNLGRRCRLRGALHAAVTDPTGHPDLVAVPIDLQPSALLAEDLKD